MHTLDENYSVVPLTRLSLTQSPNDADIPILKDIDAKLTNCAMEWNMEGGGVPGDIDWAALFYKFQRDFESAKQKGYSMPKVKGAKRSSLAPVAEELKVRFVDYSYVLDFSLYSLRY